MNALELLKSDHDAVRGLFREFKAADEEGDRARQADLVKKITKELQVHTAIEEEVLYPAARKAGGEAEDLALEGVEEHHVVDQLLEELQQLDPSNERFVPKVTVLIENVEHHAQEEEEELFPVLAELLGDDQLEQLGAQLEKAKELRETGGQAHERSKKELYEEARELNVPGRSKMSKDELAEAVSEHQKA